MNEYNYILFDGARAEINLAVAQSMNDKYQTLYRDMPNKDTEGAGPFLFSIEGKDDFNKWLIEKGWGNSWYTLVSSEASFEELLRHFRRFLMVRNGDGKTVYFRFYDPRVMRIFLPTCSAQQLVEFFGPVKAFCCEGEDKQFATRFSLSDGSLITSKISLAELVAVPVS